jgi:predicted nucleotidyltransferase component of viral defense system
MIPTRFITQWRANAPWAFNRQIEQDLIISRALVELFSDPMIAESVAFRGGTALYKLFVEKPARYSEDIDLVQLKSEPIGPVLDAIRTHLDPWLGKPNSKRSQGRVTLIYRYLAEGMPAVPMKLKIEINTQEHFMVLGHNQKTFSTSSDWFSGEATISTYHLNELLGTKMRALYQRKKGRDLFDLWYVDNQLSCNHEEIIRIFQHYIQQQNLFISKAQFEENLIQKLSSELFVKDIEPLLVSGLHWDIREAASLVKEKFLSLLPGEAWKGIGQ